MNDYTADEMARAADLLRELTGRPDPIQLARKSLGAGLAYITVEDTLLLTARASVAGLTVTFVGRLWEPDGRITTIFESLAPGSARVEVTKLLRNAEGYLLSLACFVTAGAAARGDCYVTARIRRSAEAAGIDAAVVLSGYATSDSAIGYPWYPPESPLAGRGSFKLITLADPAAGAELSQVVPAGARWLLHSLRAILTTDATVANRQPRLRFDDGAGNVFAEFPTSFAIVASSAVSVCFCTNGSTSGSAAQGLAIPVTANLILRPGDRFLTSTGAMVAGDDYSVPRALVEEWLEP